MPQNPFNWSLETNSSHFSKPGVHAPLVCSVLAFWLIDQIISRDDWLRVFFCMCATDLCCSLFSLGLCPILLECLLLSGLEVISAESAHFSWEASILLWSSGQLWEFILFTVFIAALCFYLSVIHSLLDWILDQSVVVIRNRIHYDYCRAFSQSRFVFVICCSALYFAHTHESSLFFFNFLSFVVNWLHALNMKSTRKLFRGNSL